MAQIPTPPASRHGSPSTEHDSNEEKPEQQLDHLQMLDDLLERYLHLLDQHQQLQADLGARLSSGFISLAHANFVCSTGRRYGADYYDERMKATRRVNLQEAASHSASGADSTSKEETRKKTPSTGGFQHNFAIESVTVEQPNERSNTDDESESSSTEGTANAEDDGSKDIGESTNQAAASGIAADTPLAGVETDTKSKKAKKRFRSSDPIYWYGILVPLSLRSAQESFTGAVEGQVSELANVVVEMRAVEQQIKKVRSAIGQE
ncbi:hypothetical protein BO86DRAFT_388307 [Aspergillus japonicus CBS 114.51]|uniref:Vacuolar ATPase assembly protein VMA22 n=2 Tax=Aspergillus TaxID=5052 RepID=A0A2V5IBX7_ASPV1|nr:hypothetical protein BO86DRAFT_388307 [Aspergillus japonicus CBS 114.51]PYI17126.1 hypothetical protein BO99DRAFT_404568 [Aspergillus violaceofuscus CBS 115571]RAH83094.1 hypothetical protein BO86DRAFT_388307 [Aspergillus japonicus CBS 114.51]